MGALLHWGRAQMEISPKLPGRGLEAGAQEPLSRCWDKTGCCAGQSPWSQCLQGSAHLSWDRWTDGRAQPCRITLGTVLGEVPFLGVRMAVAEAL